MCVLQSLARFVINIGHKPKILNKMKTKMNTRNFKSLSAVVLVSFFVALSSLTRANEGDTSNSKYSASARLETLMNNTTQAIRYVAPRNVEPDYTSAEIERLDRLAACTEESLKYNAAEYTEAEEVATAMDRLEQLANATIASVKYSAPAAEESVTLTVEQERLDEYFAHVETSLKYKAPAVDNQSINLNSDANENESMLADIQK
jgi:hypothetical protein